MPTISLSFGSQHIYMLNTYRLNHGFTRIFSLTRKRSSLVNTKEVTYRRDRWCKWFFTTPYVRGYIHQKLDQNALNKHFVSKYLKHGLDRNHSTWKNPESLTIGYINLHIYIYISMSFKCRNCVHLFAKIKHPFPRILLNNAKYYLNFSRSETIEYYAYRYELKLKSFWPGNLNKTLFKSTKVLHLHK